MTPTTVFWSLLFISLGRADTRPSLTRRIANTFDISFPHAACDNACSASDIASCYDSAQTDFLLNCACQFGALQDIADCASCATSNGGSVVVNGTTVTMKTFMDSLLDSCYDGGFVVPDTTYSSIIAQATAIGQAAATASAANPTATSPAQGTSPSAATFPITGSLSDIQQADFHGGVCSMAYFGDINLQYDICIGGGTVLFPESTCDGTTCTVSASTPKLGYGIFETVAVPSRMVCDGALRTLDNRPFAQPDESTYYACSCNGPISQVPGPCVGVCGGACQSGVQLAPSGTRCNVGYRCYGGPTYAIRNINNDSCVSPILVGMSSGQVDHILDLTVDGGLISCNGTTESVTSCPGENFENEQGSRKCSCTSEAYVDSCGLKGASAAISASKTSTASSSNGSGTSQGGQGSSGGQSAQGNGAQSGTTGAVVLQATACLFVSLLGLNLL